MSETTDTLVMAISEESGRLILARNGKFYAASNSGKSSKRF
jgi:DNA integrity scanning protein DisA with diadenylate cyclase activity